MGKWSVGYHDDILGAKMKSLVAGALKRSKIEKVEPTISYEAFVEELDGGDSFTTSLIELLVKEMAERRTRQTTADRRLIADRTAKSLRLLALPVHIYRDRSLGRGLGRRVNLTDYLTSPPEEMDMEEEEGDEGYDGMTQGGETIPSFIEGARVNSDLYDAYNAQGWSAHPLGSSLSRRPHTNFPPGFTPSSDQPEANNILDPIPSPDPRTRNSTWGLVGSTTVIGGGSTALTRQPSIRRSIRSRTVDFNDFSTRRRSTFRNGAADTDDRRSSEDIHGSWVSGPISDEPLNAPGVRRFFPFSRRRQVSISSMPPWMESGASTSRPVSPPEPISFRSWPSNSGPPPLVSNGSLAEHEHSPSDEPERPQLRQTGHGVRARESILSRHASPDGNPGESPPSIVISISRHTAAPAAEPATTPVSAEQ